MFTLPSAVRIYVASEPTDLRRGFDGLSALTRSVIGTDPMSGHLFVFLNRRKNRLKMLAWDRTGYVLLYNPGGHLKFPHLWPGQTPPLTACGDGKTLGHGRTVCNTRRRFFQSPALTFKLQ